jgi:hypothetical protein
LAEKMTKKADLPISAPNAFRASLFCILVWMSCDPNFSLRFVGSTGGCLRTRN